MPTFPTNVAPQRVRVSRRTAAAVVESPTSLKLQVYQHPGKRWEIEVTLPPMPRDLAAAWTQFFYDCEGPVNTFAVNLDAFCPGLSPAPGSVTFRLAEPVVGWDSELALTFGFSFRAVQAL